MRRVLPPDRFTPATASLISRIRRWYRGTTVGRNSSVPPSLFTSRPRGSVSSTGPVGPVSVLVLLPLRYPARSACRSYGPAPSAARSSSSTADSMVLRDCLVDQLAERDLVTPYNSQVPGTFLHGAFPPVRPGVVPGSVSHPGGCAIFKFHTNGDTTSDYARPGCVRAVHSPDRHRLRSPESARYPSRSRWVPPPREGTGGGESRRKAPLLGAACWHVRSPVRASDSLATSANRIQGHSPEHREGADRLPSRWGPGVFRNGDADRCRRGAAVRGPGLAFAALSCSHMGHPAPGPEGLACVLGAVAVLRGESVLESRVQEEALRSLPRRGGKKRAKLPEGKTHG